jgi:hypothetical protein
MTNPTQNITVTPDMTVQTLIDAGISLSRIQALFDAKSPSASSSNRTAFAEEVYAILLTNPTAEWKNGSVLKTWFPSGKCSDAAEEKLRVKKHQEIGRALADLAADGRLVKDRNGDSASSTFYKVVESRIPAVEPESDISTETDESAE